MTKFSLHSEDAARRAFGRGHGQASADVPGRGVAAVPEDAPPALPFLSRDSVCNLYGPGHQMHYTHQGQAVRSPSLAVSNAILDGTGVVRVLVDGGELHWRHHDPVRLQRILDLVPSKRVAYADFHALRVGPYWFNCAADAGSWQDCGLSTAPRQL